MKEISKVMPIETVAAVTKRGNAPLLVIAASSKDYDTHSSKKLIEKAFRQTGLPSSTLIMRVDDAFARFPGGIGRKESMMEKRRIVREKIDCELENQVKDAETRSLVFASRGSDRVIRKRIYGRYGFQRRVLMDSSTMMKMWGRIYP